MKLKITFFVIFEFLAVVTAARYNETCSPEIDCDEADYLSCSEENLCKCDEESAVYIDAFNECRLKANAACDIPTAGNITQKCVPYSDCKIENGDNDSKCWCKSKISETLPLGLCPQMSIGEPCTENDEAPCDASKFLQCSPSSNICECKNKNETFFDEKEDTCRKLSGASCETDMTIGAQKCVDRAICFRNVCECNTPFETDTDRQCTIPYGQACDQIKPCHTNSYQECRSGMCSCSDGPNTYYDTKNKVCRLLHGTACYPGNQLCAPNSFCDVENTRQCQCEADLLPNEMRRCALTFDRRCDVNDNLCDELKYLECNQSTQRCDCKLGSETIFDPISQKCQLLANAPCTPTADAQKCIEDTACRSTDGGLFPFECQCIGSLVPNRNRKCFLSFNTTCDDLVDKCDPAAFLTCNTDQHKCQCMRADMKYFSEDATCRLLPGSSCSIVGDSNPRCVQNSFCIEGNCTCNPGYEHTDRDTCVKVYGQSCDQVLSDCNIHQNIQCVNGTCACIDGNIPADSGKGIQCYSGYRQLCSQEIQCYSQGFLTCTAEMCECLSPSEQKFDPIEQKCLSLPGRRCNPLANPSDIALHCVANATCIPNQDITYGTCICDEDYETNLYQDQCIFSSAAYPYLTIFNHILIFVASILFQLIM